MLLPSIFWLLEGLGFRVWVRIWGSGLEVYMFRLGGWAGSLGSGSGFQD